MLTVCSLVLLAPAQPPPNLKPEPELPLFWLCGNDIMLPSRDGFGLTADSEFHWPLFVLTSPDVQKELKLTAEQQAKFDDARARLKKEVAGLAAVPANQREAYAIRATRSADDSVAAVLTAEQRKRHRQIVWQVLESDGGARAMTANPVFAKELGLSADKQQLARRIASQHAAGLPKLGQGNATAGNGPLPGEEARAKKFDAAALALLTAAQKKKWNELLGEPFQGEVKPPPIPGRRAPAFKTPPQKK